MSKAPNIITRRKKGRSRQALEAFDFSADRLPVLEDSSLQAYHREAWEAYQKCPFPTKKDEAWRRTNIRGLDTRAFRLPDLTVKDEEPPSRFLDPINAGQNAGHIIAGPHDFKSDLMEKWASKGVIFDDFHHAEEKYPDLMKRMLNQVVASDEDKFTALAAALGQRGVFLYVPKGVHIDDPLHSLFWAHGENQALMHHILVWLEEDASATFVHESASPKGGSSGQKLHAGMIELHVGRGSRLNFVELQSWGKDVWSFSRERARVDADGHLTWIFGAMGSHLTKTFSDIDLIAPGAYAQMSGFYFTSQDQHLDLDTQQNHLAGNTTSDLLYKGGLMDHSRSVWQGMIYVAPGADGTDGYQANRNLILSKSARADSIPGLEILADDVRCTHGATVGKIDETELFYLLSRGIPQHEAERLIVLGFFEPIMARIPFQGIRDRFMDAIEQKMSERPAD